jgi:hypothetical protein
MKQNIPGRESNLSHKLHDFLDGSRLVELFNLRPMPFPLFLANFTLVLGDMWVAFNEQHFQSKSQLDMVEKRGRH